MKTPHIQPFGLFVAHGQPTNKSNTISFWHSRPSNKGRQNNEIQHTERRFPLQFYNKNLFFSFAIAAAAAVVSKSLATFFLRSANEIKSKQSNTPNYHDYCYLSRAFFASLCALKHLKPRIFFFAFFLVLRFFLVRFLAINS